MNDAALLQLLQETSPEALTAEQIALLRTRLAESPELQQELANRLHLEANLAAVLGRCDITPESLLAQVEPARQRRRRGKFVALAFLLLALLATVGVVFVVKRDGRDQRQTAERSTEEKSKSETPPVSADDASSATSPAGDSAPKQTADGEPAEPSSGSAAPDDLASTPADVPVVRIEAEKFQRGNVKVSTIKQGKQSLKVISGPKEAKLVNFAEYDLSLPKEGFYDVRIVFVSPESATVGVVVNGDRSTKEAVKKPKERARQPNPEWVSAGHYTFKKGANLLRLERSGAVFPEIDRVELAFIVPAHELDAPPVESPVAKVADEPAPWQATLDADKLPKFADICFDSFDLSKSIPNRISLMRWFEPVAGFPAKIADDKRATRVVGTIDGTVRLKAPLTEDTALRLSMTTFDKLQMHFFHGERGATLVFLEYGGNHWSAYVTQRKADSPHPTLENLQLAATDEGRSRRTELRLGGPIEIRYRDGEIILSRADICLLRTPLPGPPDAVFLQGPAAFYGISLVRTSDNPFPKPAPVAAVKKFDPPAQLAWKQELQDAGKMELLSDGALRLVGDKTVSPGRISLPLPPVGPCELIFQIENATPGIGLFLANETQVPTDYLRLCKNDAPKNLLWSPSTDANLTTSTIYGSLFARVYPFATPNCWVRLTVGASTVRWALSPDGEHWAWTGKSLPRPPGPLRFGLQHRAALAGCEVTLRQLQLREFAELKSCLPMMSSDVVLNVDAAKQIVAAEQPLEIKLRALEQLVQLFDMTEATQANGVAIAKQFLEAGWAEFSRQGKRPFSSVRKSLMSAPFGQYVSFLVSEPRNVRAELLQLLHEGEWNAAQQFCRQLRFFHQQEPVKLVDWAENLIRRESPVTESVDPSNIANARAHTPRRAYGRGDALARLRANWASPLIEELSKETYNTLAELQAVLGSQAYDDAAQMIASFDPNAVQGVAPIATDERLLVSLPAAIRLSIDMNPKLQSSLEQRYGALAELRVRQAIATGNSAAVELATVQFPTTAAAAEAHRWLGDRALAAGRFAQALSAYRHALLTAGPALQQELQQRERFAAAMLGHDVGSAATTNVQFGERQLPAAEFESLVRDVRSRTSAAASSHASVMATPIVSAAPKPTGFQSHVRAKLEGAVGESVNEERARNLNALFVDWPGRQIATAIDGDALYVSNRFQLAAYDLAKNGAKKWQSKPPRGKSGKARDWSLVPMRPLLAAQQLFVRQMYGDGLTIMCLDPANGETRWATEPPKDSLFASDPVWAFDRLFVFVVTKIDQQGSSLRLASIDPETGELLTQVDLLRLANIWHTRHCCEVTVVDDALVATLSGLVVCCDLSGNVRWIRRQVVLPPDEEPEWVLQYFDRPLLHDGKLLIAQPGVRSLDCVDPITGRMKWSVMIPNLRRLLGVVDGQAIVFTDEGVEAFSATNGSRVWQREMLNISTAQLLGDAGGIALFQMQTPAERNAKTSVRCLWLDPKTGRPHSAATLPNLDAAELRFGPVIANKDRLWAFVGRGQHDPIREIVELVPSGAAEKLP